MERASKRISKRTYRGVGALHPFSVNAADMADDRAARGGFSPPIPPTENLLEE
jgi:hypothetical protein